MPEGKRGSGDAAGMTGDGLRDPLDVAAPAHSLSRVDGEGDTDGFAAVLRDLARVQRPEAPAARVLQLARGDRVGRFEIVGELGHGGFGFVYEALDTGLGRHVALKILLRTRKDGGVTAPSPSPLIELFRKEAETVAKLNHPNVITLHDFGEWRGVPYLVLERLEGRTLHEQLLRGPLEARIAVRILTQVARALVYAHAAGVIHRDLKPSNIFLVRNGPAKVLDFGIARMYAAMTEGGLAETDGERELARSGTPAYMAPEQRLGLPQDGRTDVFSAGVTLFEMVTGERPFAAATEDFHLGERASLVPEDLRPIVVRALAKEAANRFQSAAELLAALVATGRGAELAETPTPQPYLAREAFSEDDEASFFGRAGELASLEQMLARRPLVALAGASGAGKTSLVQAGLLPRLRRYGWTPIAMAISGDPLAALEERLRDLGAAAGSGDLRPGALLEEPERAGRLLRRRALDLGRRVLLFVDGFERAFAAEVPSERLRAFTEALSSAAADAQGPVRVLVALRDGCLEAMGRAPWFRAEVVQNLLSLAAPGEAELREALLRPASARGVELAPELVEQVVAALRHEPVPLPTLELVAARLWERHGASGGRRIGLGALDGLGGVAGILASHATAALARLGSSDAELARQLLCATVGPDGGRVGVYADELRARLNAPAPEVARIAAYLAGERIVYLSKAEHGEHIDLAHASLASGWALLTSWLDGEVERRKHQSRLAQATALWRSAGRPVELLWRGKRLVAERRHRAGAKAEATSEELLFLATCEEAEHRRRVRRVVSLALFAVFLCSLGLGAAHLYRQHDAGQREREEALHEARLQRTNALLQAASAATDPRLAALLLAEIEPGAEPENGVALALPLSERMLPRSVLRGHTSALTALAASPRGRRVVTASRDGTARVWRTDGRGDPIVLRGHQGEVLCAAFSPDGRRVATGGDDRTAHIFTLDGQAPLVLHGHADWVHGVEWSADGAHVLTASADHTARLWHAADGKLVRTLRGHADAVTRARFGPDGTVATASDDGTVRLWSGEGPPRVLRGEGAVRALAFDPRGTSLLAAGYSNGSLRVFPTTPSAAPLVLTGHNAAITDLAFSQDGRLLATGSEDRTARIFSLVPATGAPRAPPLVLLGHEGAVRSVAFRDDGARLVTASDDHTARLWRTAAPHQHELLLGHSGAVSRALFLTGSATSGPGALVTGSADGTARVWPADGPSNPRVFAEAPPGVPRGGYSFRSSVWNARFSPDGTRVVTAEGSGIARICRVDGSAPPLVLRGHDDEVTDAAFSPDGARVVTASRDGTARIWRADGSGVPLVLRGHLRKLFTARFSPDGKWIVTASRDGTARGWRSDGSGHPRVLRGHDGPVRDAAFSPDSTRVVTAGNDSMARVWRLGSPAAPLVLRGHAGSLRSAVFSPDGRSVLTASEDTTARVWRLEGASAPIVLRARGVLLRAHFDAQGRRILAPGEDGTVHVWSADGRGPPLVLREPSGMALAAAFDPRSARIASTSSDSTANLWAPDGSATPGALRGHKGWILAIRFSPKGDHIVTASHDGSARLWPAEGRGEGRVLVANRPDRDAAPAILETAFSPDGKRVVTTSPRGTLRLWPSDERGPPIVLRGHEGQVNSLEFSPDGRLLATASMDRTARIWPVDAPGSPQVLRGHTHWVTSVGFAPDSARVVTASSDRTARIWSAGGDEAPLILAGHTAPVLHACFSPDGRSVATASFDGTARLFDASGAQPPRVLSGHTGQLFSVAFAPDGRSLLTAGSDRSARLWRLDGAEASTVLRGHANSVVRAIFSPDGASVLTASFDGTARLWPGAGTPLVLRGHERYLWAAAFSPDGRLVVTASEDSTARLWRADGAGKPLVLSAGNAPATHAMFDARGERVAVAYGDGSARVWHLAFTGLVARLRAGTNDCLSPSERVRVLGVGPAEARAAYEACERGHGRTPQEAL